jgi:hypothetical protein
MKDITGRRGECREATMMAIPTRLRQREILNAQLTQCRRVDNTFTRERPRRCAG